jgi:hypothetical protein
MNNQYLFSVILLIELASLGNRPLTCRTKVMEQRPLIPENTGSETIHIY